MFARADALCVLRGGIGTLDETFEILTWRQLRFHDKPVILADIAGYWAPFIVLLEHLAAQGFARDALSDLYHRVSSAGEILPAARAGLAAI